MSDAARIEEIAAGFLARRDRGSWDAADQAGLDAWLDEATAHRVAWLRLQAAWTRADRLGALNAPSAAAVAPVRPRFLTPASMAAGLVGLLVVAGTASLAIGLRAEPHTYETEVGGRESVPLADGSRVELNTATRLRANVSRDPAPSGSTAARPISRSPTTRPTPSWSMPAAAG